MKKMRFASFFLALLLTISVFGINASADSTDSGTGTDAQIAEPTPQPVEPEEGFVCDTLTDPNSQSIFMVSLDTDTVVFTMNPDERRPMASLTKIMTYIVTAETVQDLQNTRTTVPESVAQELEGTGSSLAEIQTGELADLLKTVDERISVDKELSRGLGDVEVVLKEALDSHKGLAVEALKASLLEYLL